MNRISVSLLAVMLSAAPAAAQNCTTSFIGNTAYTNCYGTGHEFQDSYNAASGGGNNMGAIIAQKRNTEALINESRARRGQPPCSMFPLRTLFTGEPSC